jgi:hypothetical protein
VALPRDTTGERVARRLPLLPALLFLVPPVAFSVGFLSLRSSKPTDIGQYGLIQALHPLYFVAVGLVLVSFLLGIKYGRAKPLLLSLHIAVLVFLLHGAPSVIEREPRFATAYLHAGFSGYVGHTGKLLPRLDARFSWPSFFTGSAMLDRAAGIPTALQLVRWWPVVMNALYAPLVWLIARRLVPTTDTAWLAAGLFPLANWVGQDYYSPQSVGFLFYLTFVFILVGPLGADAPALWSVIRKRPLRWPAEADEGRAVWGPAWLWVAASLLLMAAMSTGHQITPVMACGTAIVLAVTGRTRARAVVGAFCLITLGWICYGAVGYWSGHLGQLFGQVGTVGTNVNNSVVARLRGTVAHRNVVNARVGLSIAVWSLGTLGALLWKGSKVGRRAAFFLMAWPLALIAVQSYGGEALLRIYFFALPGAVICIASLVNRIKWDRVQLAAATVAVALLLPAFLVTRWGNELFELTRPNEVAAVDALYRIAPHGSILISVSPQIPWNFRGVTTYQYEPENIDEFALQKLHQIKKLFKVKESNQLHVRNRLKRKVHPYIIITTGQIDYGWQEYGLNKDWGQIDVTKMANAPEFKLVYQNPNAYIFKYKKRIK